MVNAFTGLALGIVRMRWPSDMTMCLPSRTTRNRAFSRARTARPCEIPEIFGLDRDLNLADVGSGRLLSHYF
jgi:hypothetical protein